MNNKIKRTIITSSLFLVVSAATLTNVNAQWSVIEVNSTKILKATGDIVDNTYATSANVELVIKALKERIKQADAHQVDTDKRNRLRDGSVENLRRDLNAVPTIQQCAELTTRSGHSSSVSASLSTGGGGNPKQLLDIQKKITDNSTAQATILESTKDGKACAGGMDDAISGCSGVQTYAGADVNSSSLKKNYASMDADGRMDYSLNEEGMKAAKAYATTATMYGAPPSLTEDQAKQAKKNPAYVAIYKAVISKLNASYEALMEVALTQKAPKELITGVAGKTWEKTSKDYKATFGIEAPKIPSFYDLLNFAVMREFSGPPKDPEPKDEKELLISIDAKLALSNVIAMQQLKSTSTSNVLLAHLLTQAVTPVNVENVRAEAAKTKNIK